MANKRKDTRGKKQEEGSKKQEAWRRRKESEGGVTDLPRKQPGRWPARGKDGESIYFLTLAAHTDAYIRKEAGAGPA